MGKAAIGLTAVLVMWGWAWNGAAQMPVWTPGMGSVFKPNIRLQNWPLNDSQSVDATVNLDSTWSVMAGQKQIGTYAVSSVALGTRLMLDETLKGFVGLGVKRKRWRQTPLPPFAGMQAILGFRGALSHAFWQSCFVLEPAGFRNQIQKQHEASAEFLWTRLLQTGSASLSLAWFNGGFTTTLGYRHQFGSALEAGFVMNSVSGFMGIQVVWFRWGMQCQLMVERSARFPGTGWTLNVGEL